MGFESVEGEGSMFWFELPAGNATGLAARVLLIEDDETAIALLRGWLCDDYAVEVVRSGREALARIASWPPDVVCLDVRLIGELDGWQVLEQLKATRRPRASPS